MQLNRTGIGLIAFFGLAGAAFAIVPILAGVPGEVAAILASIGVIWVLVAGGLLWYARRQKRKAAHQDWVFQQGLRGTATVLAASSHAEVNEMPLMSLRLDLAVPGLGTREVKRRRDHARLRRLADGAGAGPAGLRQPRGRRRLRPRLVSRTDP